MHPALSIIAFTVCSGLGYGLAAVIGLGGLDPATAAGKAAHVVAGLLIAGGLMSSTLHLGNPQRAWRAFSQWRSSWLSREGVLAVASFVPLSIMTLAALFQGTSVPAAGAAMALLAAATVYSTAMIYASLKSVHAWRTPLTPACYLLFAMAGGLVAATFFAALGGGPTSLLAGFAILALAAAWAVKLAWRHRMLREAPISTPESATGLGDIGRVRPFEAPHTNPNYLTREMGFRVARKHAAKLAVIALLLGGVAPALLLVLAMATGGAAGVVLTFLAALSHVAGMLIERWLFFAEARHAVMNYYAPGGD